MAAALTIGGQAWLAAILFGLPVLTLITIPRDLRPGEYDHFAIGVVAALLIAGMIAWSAAPTRHSFYGRGDDPCAAGCTDTAY